MILLLLLSPLFLHPIGTLNTTIVATINKTMEEIAKFGSVIPTSRLHDLLPSIEAVTEAWNRPLNDNSTSNSIANKKKYDANESKLKDLKDLIRTTSKYGEFVPAAGQYIKMTSTSTDYIISNGGDEMSEYISQLDKSINEARLDILSKLHKIHAVIGEGPFEEIRTQAGTLLRYLMDALASLSDRQSNVDWWRDMSSFLELCRRRDPQVLVNDVEQLLFSPNRYLVYSMMENDAFKKNSTLEEARKRIIKVLHTLTLKYGSYKILNRVERIINQVNIDVANYVTGDNFSKEFPDLINNALKDIDGSDLQLTASTLLAALQETASDSRFVVVAYREYSWWKFWTHPFRNSIYFYPTYHCSQKNMMDVEGTNLYIDPNRQIAVYRSREAHAMNETDMNEFQERNFMKSDGIEDCKYESAAARRNATTSVGFLLYTVCPNFKIAVDKRVRFNENGGFRCSMLFHGGMGTSKAPQFHRDNAFPL